MDKENIFPRSRFSSDKVWGKVRQMKARSLGTTVVGSYSFPSWLEYTRRHLEDFGSADQEEMIEDAVLAAVHDQVSAGLDVITDGEQTRLDFNLSFYGFLEGIDLEIAPPRLHGPPAHDQRGKHRIIGELTAPKGLGTVKDFMRLKKLAHRYLINGAADGKDCSLLPSPRLKASVPGPYTLSGRLIPNEHYPNRYAVTEALLPIVRKELEDLVAAGCMEVAVDEPSMSCYAHREDPERFVDIFNRTVETVADKCRLSTHLCFGNFKGHAVGLRRYSPMFPAFQKLKVSEIHVEMASREFAELPILAAIAETACVAVGIVDVKSYYIETVEDITQRVRKCLKHAPAEQLSFAPDCGLSQTARWAAKQKLRNLAKGVRKVRRELGIPS